MKRGHEPGNRPQLLYDPRNSEQQLMRSSVRGMTFCREACESVIHLALNLVTVRSCMVSYKRLPAREDPWIPQPEVRTSRLVVDRGVDGTNRRVRINVSGLVFETYESTLAAYPETLLGSPEKRTAYYDSARDEHYFDRDRKSFDAILFFYQSGGRLIRPDDVPERIFDDEVAFFELKQTPCARGSKEVRARESNESRARGRVSGTWAHFHAAAAEFVDELMSRGSAKLVVGWSICATVAFVSSLCFRTLTDLQQAGDTCPASNNTTLSSAGCSGRAAGDHFVFSVIEKLCVSWFLLEYLSRLAHAKSARAYFVSVLGLIDFLSFFAPSVLMLVRITEATAFPHPLRDVFRFLPFLSLIKLTRYSVALRLFWVTLRSNTNELAILVYCLLINLVAFSGLVFYCEYEDNALFSSIPATFWYTIVTMTTVGYGDVSPLTFGGKIFGALCALLGVTYVLAIPTTVVASNFNAIYQAHKKKREQKKSHPRRADARIPERYRWTTQYRSVCLARSRARRTEK